MASGVKGTLKYASAVQGYIFRSFDPLEIETPEPWVEKVVVECRDESPIVVTVAFAAAPSVDTALISGKAICRTVVGRLALKYGLCAQEPLLTSEELEEEKDGTTVKAAASAVALSCSGKDSKRVEQNEAAELEKELEDLRPHRHDYEELYRRIAMQAADAVDRYMSLYRILSLLCLSPTGKEEQKYVDDFIEQETTAKRQFKRPDKQSVLETVYSRLRNEVGHARPGVDLATTRREMDTLVYELAAIAKKAIERKT